MITKSLNENINEKWTYVIHYGWHPLMIDNKVAFVTIFATIHKWLMTRVVFSIAI